LIVKDGKARALLADCHSSVTGSLLGNSAHDSSDWHSCVCVMRLSLWCIYLFWAWRARRKPQKHCVGKVSSPTPDGAWLH
jgi:hypothetical protein